MRRATADEVVDVRHAVLRAGRPRASAIFEGDDAPTARHWLAADGGRVIGVVSVIAAPYPGEGPAWQLRGMAVLPECQGQRVGEALLRAVHAEVAAPMWCNARAGVVGFYARHGWVAVGEPFEIPPIGPHQRMVTA